MNYSMKYVSVFFLILLFQSLSAQNIFKAKLIDKENGEPLIGAVATIKGTSIGSSADSVGYVELRSIPVGTHIIEFRFVGFKTEERSFVFPIATSEPVVKNCQRMKPTLMKLL